MLCFFLLVSNSNNLKPVSTNCIKWHCCFFLFLFCMAGIRTIRENTSISTANVKHEMQSSYGYFIQQLKCYASNKAQGDFKTGRSRFKFAVRYEQHNFSQMGLQQLRWSLDDSKRFQKVKILSVCFQLVVNQIFFMPDLQHFCYDDSYRWRTNNHVCFSWHNGWKCQYRNREKAACLYSKLIFETASWILEKL